MDVPVRIAADHPALAGHFPGHPVVPGAVLLDEVLYVIRRTQAAAAAGGEADAGWRIDTVKFHRLVRPGLQLHLQCRPASGGGYAFELQAGGERYVSGTVSPG